MVARSWWAAVAVICVLCCACSTTTVPTRGNGDAVSPPAGDASASSTNMDAGLVSGNGMLDAARAATSDATPHVDSEPGPAICAADSCDVNGCRPGCGCAAIADRSSPAPAGCRCDWSCVTNTNCCPDACSAFGVCAGPVTHTDMNIYTHWEMASTELNELESVVRIDRDPSGQSFFWATTFWLGVQGGYIGLQTVGSETQGKVARLSIWDSQDATPGPGAGCRDFDGEGIGKTCWLPLAWAEGTAYAMRVGTVDAASWRGEVVNIETGDSRVIGDIAAPPGGSLIASNVSAFTEYYGASLPACDALNPARAEFTRPVGNRGAVVSQRTGASIGPSACAEEFAEMPTGDDTSHSVR